MSWTTERVGDVVVLGFGETFKIDFESSSAFERRIEESQVGTGKFVIDLEGVEYIDSRDLGILVHGVNSALAAGIEVKIVGPTEAVREVFRVTHLDRVYDVFPDRKEALASFGPDGS